MPFESTHLLIGILSYLDLDFFYFLCHDGLRRTIEIATTSIAMDIEHKTVHQYEYEGGYCYSLQNIVSLPTMIDYQSYHSIDEEGYIHYKKILE